VQTHARKAVLWFRGHSPPVDNGPCTVRRHEMDDCTVEDTVNTRTSAHRCQTAHLVYERLESLSYDGLRQSVDVVVCRATVTDIRARSQVTDAGGHSSAVCPFIQKKHCNNASQNRLTIRILFFYSSLSFICGTVILCYNYLRQGGYVFVVVCLFVC